MLFVYGTLRREAASPMAALLQQCADAVGGGTYQGKLFRIAHGPGVVASDDPADQVEGEPYRLRDPQRVLAALDAYGTAGPGVPRPAEYVRAPQPVRRHTGRIVAAWVCLHNWPTADAESISSGDWLHVATRACEARADVPPKEAE